MSESTSQPPRLRMEAFHRLSSQNSNGSNFNDSNQPNTPNVLQFLNRNTDTTISQREPTQLIPINVMIGHIQNEESSQQRTVLRNVEYHQDQLTQLDPPRPTARDQWQAFFQKHRLSDDAVPDGNRPVILSVENQRVNTHWGDILMEKPPSVTRIYSMNVNGLSLDRRGGKFSTACLKVILA
jgi:hypothetical protein